MNNKMKKTEKQSCSEKSRLGGDLWFWIGRLFLFCGLSVYLELALHIFVFRAVDSHIFYPMLFGVMAGAASAVLVSLLPPVAQRVLAVLLVLIQCLFAETQLIYHAVFGGMMPVSQLAMGGGVITEFFSQTVYTIRQNLVQVLLLLLPLAVLVLVMLRKGLRRRFNGRQILGALALLIVLAAGTGLVMRFACSHTVRVWRVFSDAGTSADLSYRHVGMTATTMRELTGIIFGEGKRDNTLTASDGAARSYDPDTWNVLPQLDFQALADSTDNEALAQLDRYFAGVEPTRKNAFTGCLKGYNVIFLCAESYSPMFVTPELTPTLYRMSHSSFVFENYYGSYTYMTTNGEYTACLGLYPDMTRSKFLSSFNASVGHYLPFCLGTALKQYGYTTLAYHNNNGEFYNRSQTHPNMGYDFRAVGTGLDMTIQKPASDLEMMKASVDQYINQDNPFHVYYMTYSGHYHYTWGNAMSAKHREEVENLPYSEEVKAYIACNLEVEYALSYLEQRLADAGKLDRTLIVLTNDHYPYGLSPEQYNELAGREIDVSFEKYRNHFICYAPGLEQTIRVKTYCSTADILPTILNLLGVDYDSRLLAGSDVLSEGRHAAILYDGSFITDRFRYNANTGEVIPEPGVTVDSTVLEDWKQWVENKFTFSSEILDTDYYAHVFPDAEREYTGGEQIPFDDATNVHKQSNALFVYRRGLMDLYAERCFGFDEAATAGDFVTAIYRYLESPETSEKALPKDYLADRKNGLKTFRESASYSAVCWAFETGLLRPSDRLADYDAALYNVDVSLLLHRAAAILKLGETAVGKEALNAFDAHDIPLTDEERESMVWCTGNGYLGADETGDYLRPEREENLVTRYRLCLLLMKLLYPDVTR